MEGSVTIRSYFYLLSIEIHSLTKNKVLSVLIFSFVG